MRKILTVIIAVVIALITIYIVVIAILTLIMITAMGKGAHVPTDAEMIEHFRSNEVSFEELRSMIEKDTSLRNYPLSVHEEKDSTRLSISTDRALEYDYLMGKIQITCIWNRHLFVYLEKGDATWEIVKGFEYVPDRTIETDKEFTEKELYDLAITRNYCVIYKRINDNWNLYLRYDR